MLREVLQQENDKYRQRLAIGDVVLNTVLRNERAQRYLGEYIKKQYNTDDIPFSSIDTAFVRDYHLFLRVDKGVEQNTANKYCKILKKVVVLALDNKWMEINPFQGCAFRLRLLTDSFSLKKNCQQS